MSDYSTEALSSLSDAAKEAAEQAKSSAASLASDANDQLQDYLTSQIGAGADLVKEVAEAARTFADSLKDKSPHMADLVRGAAQSVDDFSDSVRSQTPSELLEFATDYARRQPAIFVGAAAAAGFLAVRFFKSNPPASSLGGAASNTNGTKTPSALDHAHDA